VASLGAINPKTTIRAIRLAITPTITFSAFISVNSIGCAVKVKKNTDVLIYTEKE
jgi:hypothetical protein